MTGNEDRRVHEWARWSIGEIARLATESEDPSVRAKAWLHIWVSAGGLSKDPDED